MSDLKIVNYEDLKLKRSIDTKVFAWGNTNVIVKKNIPIESKYDIVMITLQQAWEDGYYNPIKLDMHFHLNLVYMYTNLVFTEEQKQDEGLLFDEMENTGFMDKFLENINSDDYKEMQKYIDEIAELSTKTKNGIGNLVSKFIDDLPINAKAAAEMVENFDPEKYQAVVDFAKAANGGRPVK